MITHAVCRRLAIVAVSVVSLASLLSCNHATPEVWISFRAVDECSAQGYAEEVNINQLVEFEGRLIGDAYDPAECAWEWQFGDGGSADEPTAWHEYRAPGPTGEWDVELTVTAPDGTRGFSSVTIAMEEPLAGYVIQEVGTCTTRVDRTPVPQPRPEIPQQCQLIRQEAGVEAPWWEVSAGDSVFLVAELFALPRDVVQVLACWTLFYRGESRDGAPVLIDDALWGDPAMVVTDDLVNAAVLLEVGPDVGVVAEGWYEVFVRITAPSTQMRDWVGFLLHVTSEGT